ncbi:MAG TPA: hypothetical protein VK277_01295 [Acidimicrobiales bacterium]|nr:hypothetical protein [Acidimicrobiales bacterium]
MTNPFYSSEQTEQSRAVLEELLNAVPEAILIGGWGTWARVGGAMSHDVDLIVTRGELAQITRFVDEISESHHLAGTQWRGTWRGIHLDLYAPYQSRLGANLQLRVEALVQYAEVVEGRRLLRVPAHVATKVAALLDRPDSLPGRKDRQELKQLLALSGSGEAAGVISAASMRSSDELAMLVDRTFAFLAADPNLNRRDRAHLQQTAQTWRSVVALDRANDLPTPSPDLGIEM